MLPGPRLALQNAHAFPAHDLNIPVITYFYGYALYGESFYCSCLTGCGYTAAALARQRGVYSALYTGPDHPVFQFWFFAV